MKKYKDLPVRVNMCWIVGEEKKCATLNKQEAYTTRKWVEDNDGTIFWFQPLPD